MDTPRGRADMEFPSDRHTHLVQPPAGLQRAVLKSPKKGMIPDLKGRGYIVNPDQGLRSAPKPVRGILVRLERYKEPASARRHLFFGGFGIKNSSWARFPAALGMTLYRSPNFLLYRHKSPARMNYLVQFELLPGRMRPLFLSSGALGVGASKHPELIPEIPARAEEPHPAT